VLAAKLASKLTSVQVPKSGALNVCPGRGGR
jgi:hypothetical protein